MTNLEQLIDTYFAAWNEDDDGRRAELCRQVWTSDGRYVDPAAEGTGPEGIAQMIGAVRSQFPGHQVRRTTGLDAHHDAVRFGWDLLAPDGSVPVAGIDVAVVADGRLALLTGFFGEVEAVAA
jgi:hypothetical protein